MVFAKNTFIHISLMLIVITTFTKVCYCELEASPDALIKEDDTVTLWCATGNE